MLLELPPLALYALQSLVSNMNELDAQTIIVHCPIQFPVHGA